MASALGWILGRLIHRCATMSPVSLTAGLTAVAVPGAVVVGTGTWAVLERWDMTSHALMLAVSALIVAAPLAALLAATLAWIRQQNARLAEQESQLRLDRVKLVSAQRLAKLGHWRWTLGTDFYEVSREIRPILGIPMDEPHLPMKRLLELVHPDDRAFVRDALRGVEEESRPRAIEYRIRAPDGATRTIWVDGQCECDADGKMVAVFGAIQDVSERRAIEDALRAALDGAESSSRAKSAFLATMSHELRTPLNAIIGFSEMIRDRHLGPAWDGRYAEYAGDIHDSGVHLLGLVQGLLDQARVEAGRYDLHEEPLDLHALIERAVRTIGPVAARKGVTIEVAVDCPAPVVVADARALHQVMLNLLSNAAKFSGDGAPVFVRCRCDDGVAIEVEDRGIGIPAAMLAEIGRPFVQARNGFDRNVDGTGIGLSVARSLVELHGGSLSIASRQGEGTRVTIRLPASRLVPEPGTAAA